MKDWKIWVIAGLVVVIILLWVTRPEPVKDFSEVTRAEERIKERNAVISDLKDSIRGVMQERKEDSIERVREKELFKTQIKKYQRRMDAIDTEKATAPELDSLLNILYP
jgi:hypothetical protein